MLMQESANALGSPCYNGATLYDDMLIPMKSMWEHFETQGIEDEEVDEDENEEEVEPESEEVQYVFAFVFNLSPTCR